MKFFYVAVAGAAVIAGAIYRDDDESADYSGTRDDAGVENYRPVGDDWRGRQAANTAYIASLAQNDRLEDVVQDLGDADFSQHYDNGVEVLMYRTRSERTDFLTTKDETAALVFQNGSLIGFRDSKHWFDGNRVKANVRTYRAEQADNRRKIRDLAVGEKRSDIIEKLGQPDFVDRPGDDLEILSYRTRSVSLEGSTSRNETTPVMLKDGVLLATGVRDA
ncbi:MAG: DUF3192 domain-containing protein [Gammaproteobacteria bacterium]|nr:DUF3192 domain-containing protein [Gammaproteobacteria bacterium]